MLFLNKLFFKKNPSYKPVVLLILDGFGIAPDSEGNAITRAKKPNINYLLNNYPNGSLIASGEAVGLPANEVGNTEVGHLTLGAGRVVLQDLNRINSSIKDETFYDNQTLVKAAAHVKSQNSALHIIGLFSSGNVHSSKEHLFALLKYAQREEIKKVYLHIFTDGRDSPPKEAQETIKLLQSKIFEIGIGEIATISGRYYAMDRDRRWDRTKKAFDAIVHGVGATAQNPDECITESYSKNIFDEFIDPTVILKNGRPTATLQDNDAIVLFNFRVDRPRQLAMAFTIPDFENLKAFEFGYISDVDKGEGKVELNSTFQRGTMPKNLFFATMTEYQKNIPVSGILFPPLKIDDPLGFVLSQNSINQIHISESEKERFVTYYFDGLSETQFQGEETLIIPSPKVATYDKRPQMSVQKLSDKIVEKLYLQKYGFFVVNFANPDMVGHTGNFKKTVEAIGYVDKAIKKIVNSLLDLDGFLIITADHGNAEELVTYPQKSYFFTTDKGSRNTDHSNNPVPVIFVQKNLFGKKIELPQGTLADIAPTILSILNIQKPASMTGINLLKNISS